MKKNLLFFLLPYCVFSQQVGINTTDPKATLDVNGNMKICNTPTSTGNDILTIGGVNNIVTKFNFPGFDLFNSMQIPICHDVVVGTKGTYIQTVNGTNYTIGWEILSKNFGTNTNLSAGESTQRLRVKYTFTPALPAVPQIAFLTPFNNSSYPDAFTTSYANLTASEISVNINRVDYNSVNLGFYKCWAGQFYFNMVLFY